MNIKKVIAKTYCTNMQLICQLLLVIMQIETKVDEAALTEKLAWNFMNDKSENKQINKPKLMKEI